MLCRESTGSDQSVTLYAAELWRHRWVRKRERVARPWPSDDQDIDVAINPCNARPTVAWILPPTAGDERIVSSTGPAFGRPDRRC